MYLLKYYKDIFYKQLHMGCLCIRIKTKIVADYLIFILFDRK